MDLSRRLFLRGALAVTAASFAPVPVASILPRIWGDGVYEDTDGLQAALDGRPFLCEGNMVSGGDYNVAISNGDFRISRTLHIRRPGTLISYSRFTAPDDIGCMFQVRENVCSTAFVNNIFTGLGFT